MGFVLSETPGAPCQEVGSPETSGLQGAAWTVSRDQQPPELQEAASAVDKPPGWGLQTQRPTAAESTATCPFDRTDSAGRGRRSPHLGEPWTRCVTPCRGASGAKGSPRGCGPGWAWRADHKAREKPAGRASRLTARLPPSLLRPHTCPNQRAEQQRVHKSVLRQT